MAEAAAYEEQRRRQIEANKRKLEELQLHRLSAAVREAAAAAKPAKKRKTPVKRDAAAGPLRRSGRLAELPEKPVYREANLKSAFVQVSKSNARVVVEPQRWSGRLANLPEKPIYREYSDEESSYQDSEEEMSNQDSEEEMSNQDSDELRSHQDSDKRANG